MRTLEEGDYRYQIKVKFLNRDYELVTPFSISYTVYCLTTKEEIVSSTSITPADTIILNFTPSMVTIQDNDNNIEKNRICIIAVDINGNSRLTTIEYEVKKAEEVLICG